MDELDLHTLSVGQALEIFIRYYNQVVQAGSHDAFVVVHGYGSGGAGGEIRSRLRALLTRSAGALAFEPGEVLARNPGMTVIYPYRPLPTLAEMAAGEILAFCAEPKSQEKIANKFRLYGQPAVVAALRALEKEGKLRRVYKGKHKAYVAAGASTTRP